MKSKLAGSSRAKICSSRWLAYATASAAATLGAQQAAAAIHYSGPVDFVFPNGEPDQVTEQAFPLDQPGDSIVFLHNNIHFLGSGFAGVAVHGLVSGKFRGPLSFGYYPAAKLPRGTYVSKGHFSSPLARGISERWRATTAGGTAGGVLWALASTMVPVGDTAGRGSRCNPASAALP